MAKPNIQMKIENRVFPVELRVEGDDEKRTIVGHAAVFNKLSLDLGGFRERIIPGAFGKAIKGAKVRKLKFYATRYTFISLALSNG